MNPYDIPPVGYPVEHIRLALDALRCSKVNSILFFYPDRSVIVRRLPLSLDDSDPRADIEKAAGPDLP